jgi:hypothetical protein
MTWKYTVQMDTSIDIEKLVNKIKYILSKLQIKSLKYGFLIIDVLICCTVFLARWNLFLARWFLGSTTQKKLRK